MLLGCHSYHAETFPLSLSYVTLIEVLDYLQVSCNYIFLIMQQGGSHHRLLLVIGSYWSCVVVRFLFPRCQLLLWYRLYVTLLLGNFHFLTCFRLPSHIYLHRPTSISLFRASCFCLAYIF